MSWLNTLTKGILASTLAMASCTGSTQEDLSTSAHYEWESLVSANNSLAIDLYERLAAEKEGNLLISPYSALSALSLVYQGAKKDTLREMTHVLHLPHDPKELANSLKALTGSLEKKNSSFSLISASDAWVDNRLSLNSEFENAMRHLDGIKRVDFRDTTRARAEINTSVAKVTRGMIQDLLTAESLSSDTQLALVNALYLKAKWAQPFKAEKTRKNDFHLINGERVDASFMHQVTDLPLYSSERYDAVELPYLGSDENDSELVMRLYLPHDPSALAAIEAEILGEQLGQTTVTPWPDRKVALWIPKFTFDDRSSLSQALQALGMNKAFSLAQANFSGITEQAQLAIDDIVQKTKVKVDEEGTEAAAATAVTMVRTAIDFESEIPYSFEADHPFLFSIQDKTTGTVLFVGRVMNPVQ